MAPHSRTVARKIPWMEEPGGLQSMGSLHTVKGFGIVNKAEIDVFLEFSCFFYDPVDVGIPGATQEAP